MAKPDSDDVLIVPDAAGWRKWLAAHHSSAEEVTLVLAKKGVTEPTNLGWDTALEEALCFGWIDGRRNARDDTTYLQRFTPRRARSMWSARNVGITDRLIAEGRMEPAGLAQIDRAKADGRWDAAYAGPATIEVPDDLAAALKADAEAAAMFATLTSQNRFAVLHRIGQAKKAETRARRIEQFVTMLARGETIYPQKRTREAT
ncbi:MAG: YdeI/OmpD-associated family protein [Microthrixaceae bacterium]